MRNALELATRLANIADAMIADRRTQISDASLRTLRDEVEKSRMHLSETEFQIDYQATCLIECISELAYARSDGDAPREERAKLYIEKFRTFLRIDCDIAERKAKVSS